MTGCCADYCTNSYKKGFKMCKFPMETKRRSIWTKNVNRKDWIPGPGAALCERHFTKDMWETNFKGQCQLKRTAVPTIFQRSVSDSHPAHDSRQNQLKPLQFCTSNDQTEKNSCENIAHASGEMNTQNNEEFIKIEESVILEPEIKIEPEFKDEKVFDRTTIPKEETITTSIAHPRTVNLEKRLDRLEKLLSKSELSRIILKKKLDAARKRIERLNKQVCTAELKESVSKLFDKDQIKLLTA